MKPNKFNFNVPGRFEEHFCTFVTWPCKGDKEIDLFRKEIASVIKVISKYEKTIIIADPEDFDNAKELCSDFADTWSIPTDMSWIRDNGPIFIRNKKNEVAAVHFKFNGYGNKFTPHEKVQKVPQIIADKLNIQCFSSNLIVEGGGVSFDGQGTLITTEQMLMNSNRNSNFTRKEIENELRNTLGIEKVIWLKKGLVEDKDTDGHVDCVVEYITPGKIIAQTVHEKNNPNYELLQDNLKILNNATDAKGRKLEIVEMPYLPYFPKLYKGNSYVSPYTNYYIVNNAILVPEVDPKLDHLGYKIIEDIFPKRDIVPIPAFYQSINGGGPGCITQQLPTGNNISFI